MGLLALPLVAGWPSPWEMAQSQRHHQEVAYKAVQRSERGGSPGCSVSNPLCLGENRG